MATRFYFSADAAAPISPSFDAGWEQTGQAVRSHAPRKAATAAASTLANTTAVTVPITTTQQILGVQFVTDPLRYPIRLAGTFSMVLRGQENATNNNVFLAYVLRLLSNDGGTVRATLSSSMTNAGTEFTTSSATRIFSAVALTATTAQAGDRLCLEVGGHAQAPAGAGSYTYRFGFSAASDFALTSGTASDLNPWWEIDQDLFGALPNNQTVVRAGSGISVTEGWR